MVGKQSKNYSIVLIVETEISKFAYNVDTRSLNTITLTSKTAVIIEDFKLISQIWQSILEGKGVAVIKQFDNADDIEKEIIELVPDIVLLDINLKGKVDGIELTIKLKRLNPNIRILILTMHDSFNYMNKAYQAGALGYIHKNSQMSELNLAIDTVLSDQLYFKSIKTE